MAKSDGKGAVGAVIAAAAGAAAAPAADQLDMLMPPTRASLTENQQERVDAAIKHDRRGRPPGAQNKATREMLEFVRKMCGDPLERRFRYAMHTPETLAIELSCTKLEAFDRLERMWADLSRYFYAQQSQVDGQGNAVAPRLTMVFPGQSAPVSGPDGAPRAPWLYIEGDQATDEKSEQNQRSIAASDDMSHDEQSHGDG